MQYTTGHTIYAAQNITNQINWFHVAPTRPGGCGLSMDPVDHQALLDLFMTNRGPTARAGKHGWGVGVTSLSGWYYALSLHDDGRLACLNLNDHDLEGILLCDRGDCSQVGH